MRTIDITTTQNVTIQYELAPLRDRIFAFLIDVVIWMVGISILTMIFGVIGLMDKPPFDTVMVLLLILVFFLYSPVSEMAMNGQTFGKKALGIRVVKLDGTEPQLNDYLMRWAFRMVDIWLSFGGLAAILITSSENSQRVGGILSRTAVIRDNPSKNLGLRDMLRLHKQEEYEPKFPQVTKMTDKDMLLVKQVLNRVEKYPNDAHKDALKHMVGKLRGHLGIETVPENPKKFLKTLIKDYIVLTR